MSVEIERLIAKETPRLRRYALRLCKDPVFTEDLVQMALVRVWKHRDKFEVGTNFGGWCFTILKNEYLDHLKKKSTKNEKISLSKTDGDDDEVFQYDLPVPARQDKIAELAQARRLVENLPTKFRNVIVALVFEQKAYEEYASEIEKPIGTVKNTFHRAIREFNRMVGNDIVYKRSRV